MLLSWFFYVAVEAFESLIRIFHLIHVDYLCRYRLLMKAAIVDIDRRYYKVFTCKFFR